MGIHRNTHEREKAVPVSRGYVLYLPTTDLESQRRQGGRFLPIHRKWRPSTRIAFWIRRWMYHFTKSRVVVRVWLFWNKTLYTCTVSVGSHFLYSTSQQNWRYPTSPHQAARAVTITYLEHLDVVSGVSGAFLASKLIIKDRTPTTGQDSRSCRKSAAWIWHVACWFEIKDEDTIAFTSVLYRQQYDSHGVY